MGRPKNSDVEDEKPSDIQLTADSLALTKSQAVYMRIAQLKVVALEDYRLLWDLLKEVKFIVKRFDEEMGPEIAKAHELHKALIARRKRWADKFAEAEQLAKEKVLQYAETADAVPAIEGGSISETWTGEVEDPNRIPREYMTPDLEKLKGLTKVMKEATSIPGWKCYPKRTVSVRA